MPKKKIQIFLESSTYQKQWCDVHNLDVIWADLSVFNNRSMKTLIIHRRYFVENQYWLNKQLISK